MCVYVRERERHRHTHTQKETERQRDKKRRGKERHNNHFLHKICSAPEHMGVAGGVDDCNDLPSLNPELRMTVTVHTIRQFHLQVGFRTDTTHISEKHHGSYKASILFLALSLTFWVTKYKVLNIQETQSSHFEIETKK